MARRHTLTKQRYLSRVFGDSRRGHGSHGDGRDSKQGKHTQLDIIIIIIFSEYFKQRDEADVGSRQRPVRHWTLFDNETPF